MRRAFFLLGNLVLQTDVNKTQFLIFFSVFSCSCCQPRVKKKPSVWAKLSFSKVSVILSTPTRNLVLQIWSNLLECYASFVHATFVDEIWKMIRNLEFRRAGS